MSIQILCDSSADFTQQEISDLNLLYIPIPVLFGEESFAEGVNMTKDEFYTKLKTSPLFPTTSQPSPDEFVKVFQQAKNHGDEIIALLIPNALSGTLQSACLAKSIVQYDKIHIIDSLSAAAALRILITEAVDMCKKGYSCEEIITTIEQLKTKTHIYAALDTLENLHRGGRLTKAQTGIGEFAGIKPIITLTEEGKVILAHKSLGKSKACKEIIRHITSLNIDKRYPLHFIYSHNKDNLNLLISKLEKSTTAYQNCESFDIGPTIGTHIGTGAYGICCILK